MNIYEKNSTIPPCQIESAGPLIIKRVFHKPANLVEMDKRIVSFREQDPFSK